MLRASIAQDKADVMEGTKTSSRAIQMKLKREEELKERLAVFTVFNRNVARAQKLGSQLEARRARKDGDRERAGEYLCGAYSGQGKVDTTGRYPSDD